MLNASRVCPCVESGGAAAVAGLGFALLATGCSQSPGLGQDFLSTSGHHEYLPPFHRTDFHHPTVINNPYYPTRYAIDGLRQSLFYPDLYGFGTDMWVLLGTAAVAVVAGGVIVRRAWSL